MREIISPDPSLERRGNNKKNSFYKGRQGGILQNGIITILRRLITLMEGMKKISSPLPFIAKDNRNDFKPLLYHKGIATLIFNPFDLLLDKIDLFW